jgi:signal peptidase I
MTSVAPAPDGGGPNPPDPAKRSTPTWLRGAIEWVVVIVGAVAVALVIQITSVQAFYIPSESMSPTLEVGDRLLVNKWSYRLHDVNRGDIVVFERPDGETSDIKDLVKRVIALPNETVTISDGHVLIDGHVLDEPYLPDGVRTEAVGSYPCPPANPCHIPEGHVWVMGDNRTESKDSRFFDSIPESKIVGRAFFRVWPIGRIGTL